MADVLGFGPHGGSPARDRVLGLVLAMAGRGDSRLVPGGLRTGRRIGFEDEDVFAAFALDDADPVLDDIDDLEADLASGTRGDLVDEDALPRPDRIRIFAIPDAEQPDESTFFDEPFLSGELDPFDTGEDPIEVGGDDDG